MKRHFVNALILAALFSLAGGEKTLASEIIYTFSGVGSGTLGADSFTDASYEITLYADTSKIVVTPLLFGESFVPDLSATVFVNGLGTATITSQMVVYDFNDLGMVGPATIGLYNGDDDPAARVLAVHPGSKDYFLSEAIGPIGGALLDNPGSGASFATSDGNFSFSSLVSVRFQAAPQAVPESSMTALVCATSLALGLLTRKKRNDL